MAGMPETYTDEVIAQLGLLGAWLPLSGLALGDIGVMDGRAFVRESSLADHGIAWSEHDDSSAAPRDRGVNSGAALQIRAGGEAGGPLAHGVVAEATAEITFGRAHSILMRAEGCRRRRIDRLDLVKKQVLAAHSENRWQEDWYFVSEVQEAERLLVLIARESNATATLALGAGLGPTALSLAKGSGRLGLLHAAESVFVEAGPDATPLYRLQHVKKPLAREARVEPADQRGRARAAAEQIDVVEYRY